MRILLALTTLAGGCFNCTMVGCAGTLELRFDAAAFDDGAYALTVEVGDQRLECAFDVGEVPADTAAYDGLCSTLIDGDELVVSAFMGMHDPPESIGITVERDGAPFAETRARPDWSEPYYPNGKRCGGACVGGVADVTL